MGYVGRPFLGGEYPRLSYRSLGGDVVRSHLTGSGERGRRYGEGFLFTACEDLCRGGGDLEYRRALGSGDLSRVSRLGENLLCGDRPL